MDTQMSLFDAIPSQDTTLGVISDTDWCAALPGEETVIPMSDTKPVNPLDTILAALRRLALQDSDGATNKNDVGFSKPDSWQGRRWAQQDTLSESDALAALDMLQKYKNTQLADLVLPARDTLAVQAREAEAKTGRIVKQGEFLIVSFPYNQKHVEKVKSLPIPDRRYEGDTKSWIVALQAGRYLLDLFPQFAISEADKAAILAYVIPARPISYPGTIAVEKNKVVLTFAYDEKLVAVVKALGAKAHKDKKTGTWLWEAPLSSAESVLDTLKDWQVLPGVREAVEARKNALSQAEQANAEISARLLANLDTSLPGDLKLFAHQIDGVKFFLNNRRSILADDMGTGKTLTALVAARAYGVDILVVCPKSLLINWQREATMASVTIATYTYAKIPASYDKPFVLICDESHAFQNITSARTKAMLTLADNPMCQGLYLLSVTGDSLLTIRENGIVSNMPIRDLVESVMDTQEGEALIEKRQIQVRSFDPKTKQMVWADVYAVQAHKSPDPLVTIQAEGKTEIKATAYHSLYVWRNGDVILPKANEIRAGDYLLRDDLISVDEPVSSLNILDRVADKSYVLYGPYKTQIDALRESVGYDTWYNWTHNGKHGPYLPYERWQRSDGEPTWIAGLKGSRGHGSSPVVPCSSIAYLLGLVVGNGWVSGSRLGLAIRDERVESTLKELDQLLSPYFHYSLATKQYRGCVNARFNCKPLVDLFALWFKGRRAPTKRLPKEVFTWDEISRRQVLRGIVNSDGHLDKRGNTTITSTSRLLLEDIRTLLKTINVASTIYKRTMKDDPRPAFKNTKQSYQLVYREDKPTLAQQRSRIADSSLINTTLLKVLSVEIGEPSTELVYDLSVRGTETFIANGIVCHNTGTPVKNGRPANLFPLLAACKHKLAQDRNAYEIYYCDAHLEQYLQTDRDGNKRMINAWKTDGAQHLDELHKNTKDIMLRRLKSECLDLPPKMRVMRGVELSDAASKLYDKTLKALQAEYQQRLAEKEILEGGEALVMLTQLRHAASVAKAENACELAQDVIEEGGQVVLFVAFSDTGKTIADCLGTKLFSGETSTQDRQSMVDDFQAGKLKALVCTLGSGGVGITLTAAQTVILVDRPYTPGDATQSEDRLHRNGQQNAVTSLWLQYGEADEAVDTILQAKQERIDLVLAGKRKTLRGTNMSAQEIAQELLPDLLG